VINQSRTRYAKLVGKMNNASRNVTFKAKHLEDFQKEQQQKQEQGNGSIQTNNLPGGLLIKKKSIQATEQVRFAQMLYDS
jgi:hypothetical protein